MSRFDLSQWVASEMKPVNTNELSKLITEMFEYKKSADFIEAEFENAKDAFNIAEEKVLKALIASNLKKYSVPGIGSVSTTREFSASVPTTIEDKRAFQAILRKSFGDDFLESVLSINSQKLQTIYKDLCKDLGYDLKDGNILQGPSIPGIPQVTVYTKLNRSKKD